MVHMIGQSVGAYTDATHGMTLSAVSLPYYRHILPYGLHQFKEVRRERLGVRPEGKTDEEIAQEGLEAMEAWMKEMGLVLHLAELGGSPRTWWRASPRAPFVMEGATRCSPTRRLWTFSSRACRPPAGLCPPLPCCIQKRRPVWAPFWKGGNG